MNKAEDPEETFAEFEKTYDPIEYKARKLKKIRLSLLKDDWAIHQGFFGPDIENRPKEMPEKPGYGPA